MTPPVTPRPRFASIVDLTTSRFTQVLTEGRTRIIRELFALAPKRRRGQVRWILLAGILVTLGVLAHDVSVREFATARAAEIYRTHVTAPATPLPPATAAIAAVVEVKPVAWPATGSVVRPVAQAAGTVVDNVEKTAPSTPPPAKARTSRGRASTRRAGS